MMDVSLGYIKSDAGKRRDGGRERNNSCEKQIVKSERGIGKTGNINLNDRSDIGLIEDWWTLFLFWLTRLLYVIQALSSVVNTSVLVSTPEALTEMKERIQFSTSLVKVKRVEHLLIATSSTAWTSCSVNISHGISLYIISPMNMHYGATLSA